MLRHILRNTQAKKNRGEEGQALVEFALTLMTFLFLLVMIIEVGRILWAFVTIQHAARLGARYAVTGQWFEDYALNPNQFVAASDDPMEHIKPCWPIFPEDLPAWQNGPNWYEPYRNARTCSVEATALNSMGMLPLDPHATYSEPGYYEIAVKGVIDDIYPETGTFDRQDEFGNTYTTPYSNYYPPASFAGDTWGASRGFAGKPQEKVSVQIAYRLPIITPLLNAIAESVRLTATATMTNEAYGGTGVQREAILPPEMPDLDPLLAGAAVDLVVTDIVLDPSVDPLDVGLNDPVDFDITIANQGALNTPTGTNFDLILYASHTELTDYKTPLPGGLLEIANVPITTYLVGGTDRHIPVTAQFSQGGEFYVYAYIDANEVIDEVGVGADTDPAREENNANVYAISPFEVDAEAHLSIEKNVDNPLPAEGEQITYTINVISDPTSSDTAPAVEVTDILPAGVTFVSSSGDGTYHAGSGLWEVGDIPVSQTRTLSIVASVDTGTARQTIVNTANNLTMNGGTTLLSGEDSATITVDATDIEVTKEVDEPFPDEGDTLTYTITAENLGFNQATNVRVRDEMPSGLINVPATATDDAGNVWTHSTGIWDIGTLAAGEKVTLVIQAEVEEGTVGTTITNAATLLVDDLDQLDVNASNNSENVISAVRGHDLQVSFQLDPDGFLEGQEFTYTIRLVNFDRTGASEVDNVTVDAAIPSGLTYISHTTNPDATFNPSTGDWVITGPIPLSGVRQLTITVRVDAPAGTTVSLTASAPTRGDLYPPDNSATSNLIVEVANADLLITKTLVTLPAYHEGKDIVYRISVSNAGPEDATHLQLTDILPTGLINIPATVTDSRGGTWNRDTGIWNIGTLTPTGGTVTLDIPATIDSGTLGDTITNTISKVDMDQNDPDPSDYDLSESLTVTSTIDLSLTKTLLNTESVTQGTTLNYEIVVQNDSTIVATGVQVKDTIPTGTTFVGATTSGGTYNNATGLWNIGNIAAGASATLSLNVRVSSSTSVGTIITNTAEVYAAVQTDADSTPNNNDATEDDQDSVSVMIAEAFADIFVNIGSPSYCGDVTWGQPTNPGELSTLPGLLGTESATWMQNQQYSPALGWGYTGSPNLTMTNERIEYPDGSNANDSATRDLFRCQASGGFQFQVDNLPAGQYRVYLAFADPYYEAEEDVCRQRIWGVCLWLVTVPIRTFDISYSIGGAPSLVLYDEYNISRAAGGQSRLHVETFTLSTSGGQPLIVYFESGSSGESSTEPLVQGIGIERIGD